MNLSSINLSKRRPGKSREPNIDLELYRNVIGSKPYFFWKETVDDYYYDIQIKREKGIINDGIRPRKHLDFYYIRNNINDEFVFGGNYDLTFQSLGIQFHNRVDSETLSVIEQLAIELDVKIYKGGKVLDLSTLIKRT